MASNGDEKKGGDKPQEYEAPHGGTAEEKRKTQVRREARDEREAKAREAEQQDRKKKRLRLLGIAAGVAALIVLIAVFVSSRSDEADQRAGDSAGPVVGADAVEKRYDGIEQDGFTLGDPDAPVRLVEFADLQCPFCKQASDSVTPALIDRYVRDGRLRMEFRNFAILGPDSEKAARAAQSAARQGKGWQFIDLFYLNQGAEHSGYVTDEFIRKIAQGVPGLDADLVVRESNSDDNETLAEANTEAQRFGVESTPSYLIGASDGPLQQLQVQDPTNPDLFAQAIDRQLGQQE